MAVHSAAKRQREDISSDEDRQDSRRGRSKLERWTSHKERDLGTGSKSSSSTKLKEDGNNPGISSGTGKSAKESVKAAGVSESQHSERKDPGDAQSKDADLKPKVDRHLDTVEKLKKRSERFKLPLPSEKEASAPKKLEPEPLPSSAKNETPGESEVKQDRPPRKRRWVSN